MNEKLNRRDSLLRKNFVICEGEKEYAKKLVSVFRERKNLRCQLYSFQSMEQLRKFAQENKIDLLLISDEFPKEIRQQVKADICCVLTTGKEEELTVGEKGVYKYQSADQILEFVLNLLEVSSGNVRKRELPSTLIGIYSPVRRIGSTRFALDMGKKLLKKGPVLYINLETYSGGDHYFPDSLGNNLGDLLYYFRLGQKNIEKYISAMTQQVDGVDYIPPISVSRDLLEVKQEEWFQLFQTIQEECIYQTVILDLGEYIQGLYEILQICNTVYTLYQEDEVPMAKLAQYTHNLRMLGFEDVLEHTVQRVVPLKEGV